MDQLVAHYSDRSAPLPPEVLEQAIDSGSWPVLLQAIRVAEARQDPALAGLLFRTFLESKAVKLPHDPDVFERALRTLQDLPPGALKSAIQGSSPGAPGELALEQLQRHWLSPIANLEGGGEAARDPVLLATLAAHYTEWAEDLLAQGPRGLTMLQSDSGDVAFRFFAELEVDALAYQLIRGNNEVRAAARETCRHRGIRRPELEEAMGRLRAAGLETNENEQGRLDQMLAALDAGRRHPQRWLSEHVRPLAPLDIDRFESSPLAEVTDSSGRRLTGILLACLALFALTALARRSARARPWLFRLAALSLAPLLLVLAEGGLALVGYEPANALRPTFNPSRAPKTLIRESELGPPWFRSGYDRMRFNHFSSPKPAGRVRIVAIGASMVHGSNYLFEEAWPAVLAARVANSLPEQQVELLNLGVGGAVSDELYFYAREALEHEPDLLIVSCGFNDFGQLSRLAEFRAFSPRGMQRRMLLDRFRLVRLISSWISDPDGEEANPQGAQLDAEPLEEEDRALLRSIASSNLEGNLRRIAWLAQQRGVPILLVAQAQNEELCGAGTASGARDPEEPDCFPPQARAAVVRAAGRAGGIPVVDATAALRGASTDPLLGAAWFQDVIHLTRAGNAVLGEAAAPEALRLLAL